MSALSRFLASTPPLPNAAKGHALPEPKLLRNEKGWIDWYETTQALSASLMGLGAPEFSQSFGRLIEAIAGAAGGHPALAEVLPLLELGDRDSVLKAQENFVEGEREMMQGWAGGFPRRSPPNAPGATLTLYHKLDPLTADLVPQGDNRHQPGVALAFGTRKALSAACDRHHRGRSATHLSSMTSDALNNLIGALMDFRPELTAAEALAITHRLLDPTARQPAPGGLWSETKRKGTSVVVRYGRGDEAVLIAEYELMPVHRPFRQPSHPLKSLGPAKGASPDGDDYDNALADLVRRCVRTVYSPGSMGPAADASILRAGFAPAGTYTDGTPYSWLSLSEQAADYWVISHPTAAR